MATTARDLARIERVDLKEVWPHEARDFTPWLAEHLDELGEALGLDLELHSQEASVGPFSLDILAREVGHDRLVAIENQLAETDHSHLGQLLTYMAGYDAGVAVWIARQFRDEHREALDLLNRRTDGDAEFFGVVVELWTIAGSPPAPHFRVVSAPNAWRRQTKQKAKAAEGRGVTEKEERYRTFFNGLLEELRTKYPGLTNIRTAPPESWIPFPAGYGSVRYNAAFTGDRQARIELYIDGGEKAWNERLFTALEERKEGIESSLGGVQLEWDKLENRRACRISAPRSGSIDDDQRSLNRLREWMIEKLLAFRSTFGPILSEMIRQAGAEPTQGVELSGDDGEYGEVYE